MKRSGTLRMKVIKPINGTWGDVGERMKVLSKALGAALNLSMREVYPGAVGEISARRRGEYEKGDNGWRKDVRKILCRHWTAEMASMFERDRDHAVKENEKEAREAKKENRPPKLHRVPVIESYLPTLDVLCSETSDLLYSRFTGDHMKALISLDSSLPSWKRNTAFFAEGRACRIEGKADEAKVSFPLWGQGKKATGLIVDPSGGSSRKDWNDLVRDFPKRELVIELESVVKKYKHIKEDDPDRLSKLEERERATLKLEELGAIKFGSMSLKRNKNKNKWFLSISWTRYSLSGSVSERRAAAVNLGCNVFLQALAEDGTDWSCPGNDILATREKFRRRRWLINRCMRSFGSGGRGHGKNRHELPLTKIGDAESRWVETRIRQIAADLISWCKRHNITDLYLEDLTGVRDDFEEKTEGDAPEQVKRFIHTWPFYQLRLAIERQAEEEGIQVHIKSAEYVSQRCPGCKHTNPENVKIEESASDWKIIDGKTYTAKQKWTRFECVSCGLKAPGDIVACANHLIDVGRSHSLEKMQEKARTRIKNAVKRAIEIEPQPEA